MVDLAEVWANRPLQRSPGGPRWLDYAVALVAFFVFMAFALSIREDYGAQQCFHFKPMVAVMQACEDRGGMVKADLCLLPVNSSWLTRDSWNGNFT